MRKAIVAGAVGDFSDGDRLIRRRRSQDENHKFCFSGRWEYSVKILV